MSFKHTERQQARNLTRPSLNLLTQGELLVTCVVFRRFFLPAHLPCKIAAFWALLHFSQSTQYVRTGTTT